MEDRYEISFTEGGVDALETIITGGLAKVAEKAVDAVFQNNNHGWYCNIKDRVTGTKVSRWGIDKREAQEKAQAAIAEEIENYEYKENQRQKEVLRLADEQRRERERQQPVYQSPQDSSDNTIYKWIGYAVGVCLVIAAAVWALVKIVIPIALLFGSSVLAYFAWSKPQKRKLFAILSIVAGIALCLDAYLQFFTSQFGNFFDSPTGLPALGFVLGLGSIGVSGFLLLDKVPSEEDKTNEYEMEATKKRKTILVSSLAGFVVLGSVAYFLWMRPTDVNAMKENIDNNLRNDTERQDHEQSSNQVLQPEDINASLSANEKQFVGEWLGYDLSYGVDKVEESKEASYSLKITKEGKEFRITMEAISGSGSDEHIAFLTDGRLVVDGRGRKFYKGAIPTIEANSDGTLMYSDGGASLMLRKHTMHYKNEASTNSMVEHNCSNNIAGEQIFVVGDVVNIRPQPSKDFSEIGKAHRGDNIPALGKLSDDRGVDWYKVNFFGQEGYVSGLFTCVKSCYDASAERRLKSDADIYEWTNNNAFTLFTKFDLDPNKKYKVIKSFKGYTYVDYLNNQGKWRGAWILNSKVE